MALKKFMKKMFKGGGSELDDISQIVDTVEETPSMGDGVTSADSMQEETLDVSFGSSDKEDGNNAVVEVFVNDVKLTTFDVSEEEVNIGRDPSRCTVLITEPIISKVHCVMYQSNGELYIKDKGSTNGIFVEGEKIEESVVDQGSIITLGRKGLVKLEVKNRALI